ncbi:MAG: hypothetical protein QNJ61_07690 [Desulfobacterales bacterium]|nr:hypothetical protein [Desulfobacterales bacterium]
MHIIPLIRKAAEHTAMQDAQTPMQHQTVVIGAHPEIDEPAHFKQRISVLAGALLAALAWTPFFYAAQATLGIQPASAKSHYGILGSQAPELDLDTWIDGRGEKTAPIHLSTYRDKVIYLYFFQDW